MSNTYFEQDRFEGLELSDASFDNYVFTECQFAGCTFESCTLAHCLFTDCSFSECTVINLRASKQSALRFACFTDCELIGVNWGQLISNDKYPKPISSFQNSHLKYNIFPGMNFKKFNFEGNDISDSIFEECQLEESSFKGCVLQKTEFTGCDMRKADFRNASGYLIGLLSNKLSRAKFSFPEVMNLLTSLGIEID